MSKVFFLLYIIISFRVAAQDSTMNNLFKSMDKPVGSEKKPFKIFESEKLINANTTELIGKGKMDFRVIHNFYDAAGADGGINNFFGLDHAADIKIGFEIGLGRRLDLITSRVRGAENYQTLFSDVQKIWELGFKYRVIEQKENDPGHPLSLAIFANTAVSSMQRPELTGTLADSTETFFTGLSDRMSQAVEVIIARKFGKLSLQLSPTYVHRNRVIPGDDKSIFALGSAARIPLSKKFAFIIDYFHVFHSQPAIDFFKTPGSAVHPVTQFYDPLGIGFEFLTAGHIFHINFTNATELLENRFIPRTVTSWSNGQFRWGFTISRTFVLCREKKK